MAGQLLIGPGCRRCAALEQELARLRAANGSLEHEVARLQILLLQRDQLAAFRRIARIVGRALHG